MKKTGRFFGAIGSLFLLLSFIAIPSAAQDVSVEATVSETTIYSGERITLTIEVSGDFNNISRPDLPELEGFRLLSNTPSTSRSYSYVNGQTSTSYSYSYYLIARDEGEFEIPPISITIDGNEMETNALNVEIVDRNRSKSDGNDMPDIFLQLETEEEEPFTGQQIVTDVVLYFKEGLEVSSYQPVPGWKAEGFWKEELENTTRPAASSTIINGERYRKARLQQFSLFPTKSGELEISSYEIMVNVRSTISNRDSFSSFFGGFGRNQRQVELNSDPITLNVQALPANNEVEYMGAVGSFDISRDINTRSVRAGESIEITTQIEGTGNIPLISRPDYEIPEGMEVYEPQEAEELDRRNHQISGTKTFTQTIIARSPGSYTLPEKQVAYFDPSTDQYVTETLSALEFDVAPNEAIAGEESRGPTMVAPVTGLANWVTQESQPLSARWWFWVGLILPLLIFGGAYWRKTYLYKMENDQSFARSRTASERAEQRLQEAIRLSDEEDIKSAYDMLSKALTGFISDRLNLPEAGMSNQDIVEVLKQQEIDRELVKNIRMLLDKCASVSYAPTTTHSYLKSHVGLAKSTLDKLKKVL